MQCTFLALGNVGVVDPFVGTGTILVTRQGNQVATADTKLVDAASPEVLFVLGLAPRVIVLVRAGDVNWLLALGITVTLLGINGAAHLVATGL